MSQTVYVTGHRNPDTDSICSSIGYAALKRALGVDATPVRLGKVNRETAFVLSHFDVKPQELLASVRGQVGDITLETIRPLAPDTALQTALEALYAENGGLLPVVGADGRLAGLVSAGDIAALSLTYLSGEEPDGSAAALQKKFQGLPVVDAMRTTGYDVLHPTDYISDARATLESDSAGRVPVVDETGAYLGFCTLALLETYRRKQVILVDHSERTQTVDGLEEADLLEIIDHHRIGDIQTPGPIYFRNEPVGCSATIVTKLYDENGVTPEPKVAGLLCSAILSDTVKFKSPTCTPVDKDTALRLAKMAGIDVDAYAKRMFEAGASLEGMSPDEIIHNDFKEYVLGGKKLGIAQVTMATLASFAGYREAVLLRSAEMLEQEGYAAVLVIVTAILDEQTEVLFQETEKGLVASAFGDMRDGVSFMMEGVVSRKKQIVPQLTKALS
ncbi:MAG: putative manganese-dependent inorganic diphosphatase [Ethanoligenens sp.]|uniref:putative manganese-dependent inorganic diphosphatase n=1 Tax=Ethanoligenens sp. TaxID=2099655 RepID=UPI0039ED570C